MLPLTSCPEATYATKPNIRFPGTTAQATAAEVIADTVVDQRLASVDGVTIAIASGSIETADSSQQ
jgi:hypothetical protein